MTGSQRLRVAFALAGLLVLLAGVPPALAQNLVLTTDKGCGDAAVFPIGELVRISYGSDRTVSARLTLGKPDGTTQTLFNGTLQGGVTRVITGRVGAPEGTRTLTHTVTLRFTQAGQALIQVWGRKVGPDTPPTGVPIVLERRVTVQ
jgi:hypothetical protein